MNPVLLQKQFKENSNDLQNFYNELKTWGEEMKRKDASLKEDSSKKPKVETTKDGKQPKPNTKLPKSSQKIKDITKDATVQVGCTDYSKWEKYDADLECEHLEEDFKDDSELTDEFEEGSRDEAIAHKEKGNSYVKMKEWDKAIECYTKAIDCYAYDPIYYANRGLCYLKKNSFIAAEADCTLSLRLDSTYVKALQRRAAARESLGKFELALSDLEIILTHEPNNKESKTALDRVRKKVGLKNTSVADASRPVSKFTASRGRAGVSHTSPNQSVAIETKKQSSEVPRSSVWPDPGFDIINVKAIKKPPHLRSKKPLTRLEITEINSVSEDNENSTCEKPLDEPEAVKKHVIEHTKKKVTFVEDSVGGGEPIEKTSAFKKKREEVNKELNVSDLEHIEKTSAFKKNRERGKNELNGEPNQNAWPNPQQPNNKIIRSYDLKVFDKTPVVTDIKPKGGENKPKEIKNTENMFITQLDNKTIKDVKADKAQDSQSGFPVPKTSVQFYATWKVLKTLDKKYEYLKLIDPQEIPKLFKESLDSKVFSSILEVLSGDFIRHGHDVYEFLLYLTQVSRFSALAMFMDSKDKNRLWELINYLRDKTDGTQLTKEQVDDLILKYEL